MCYKAPKTTAQDCTNLLCFVTCSKMFSPAPSYVLGLADLISFSYPEDFVTFYRCRKCRKVRPCMQLTHFDITVPTDCRKKKSTVILVNIKTYKKHQRSIHLVNCLMLLSNSFTTLTRFYSFLNLCRITQMSFKICRCL